MRSPQFLEFQFPVQDREASYGGPVYTHAQLIDPTNHDLGTKQGLCDESFASRDSQNLTNRKQLALEKSLLLADQTNDRVAYLCAHVRAKLLALTHRDYYRETGVSPHALRGVESKRIGQSHAQDDTFCRILADWKTRAESGRYKEVASQILDARAEVLDLLTSKTEACSVGLLRRWRIEVGTRTFYENVGLSVKTIWCRQDLKILRPFSELLDIARTLDLLPPNVYGQALWNHPEVVRARNAWISDSNEKLRPHSLSVLHVLVTCAGISYSKDGLREFSEYKISAINAEKLARYDMVPWHEVKPLLRKLTTGDLLNKATRRQLRAHWQRDIIRESQRPSVVAEIGPMMAKAGIGPTAIARMLGLPDDSATTRQSRRLVQHTIKGELFSPKVPFAAIALLVSPDIDVFNHLLSLRREEILLSMSRKGSLCGSPIQAERFIWGIQISDLPFQKKDVQSVERGRRCPPLSEPELISEITSRGAAKLFRRLKDTGIKVAGSYLQILMLANQQSVRESAGSDADNPNCSTRDAEPKSSARPKATTLWGITLPNTSPETTNRFLSEIQRRTGLSADQKSDRIRIIALLRGLLQGSFHAEFFGDLENLQGSVERIGVYSTRAELGFISVLHEADRREIIGLD